MRLADPYALKIKPPRETIIFAASQTPGGQKTQNGYFLNFNDECFVMADAVDTFPHSAVAAKFACETAIWAYKHIRQHRYYWLDKKLFMKRIFRSTNLAVWQKKREAGFEGGMATGLMVLLVGAKQYWLGVAGPSSAWLAHGGTMTKLTPETDVFGGGARDVMGIRRLGLVPYYKTAELGEGDVMIMASAGCGNYLTPMDLSTAVSRLGNTAESAASAVTSILSSAEENGSMENKTCIIVKRIDR